jgi:hypothetical protein
LLARPIDDRVWQIWAEIFCFCHVESIVGSINIHKLWS